MEIFEKIKDAKRVVVKVGTSTLTHENGKLNLRRIEKLTRVLCGLKNQDREVILVSSGAIAVGMEKLKMKEKPKETREKQAAAAVGQCELMNIYSRLFSEYGHKVAQILLTRDVLDHDLREKNAVNTFNTLIELGVVPIVNENDSISTDEIEFGDNDTLSAVVAVITKADVLILLTDIDGLYDCDPHKNQNAKFIGVIDEITDEVYCMAGGSGRLGTGGMVTKIRAAQIVTGQGIDMVIANGQSPDILYEIFDGVIRGTLFVANK